MKKLTIQFAGYGLQDETVIHGFETSAELLQAIAKCDDSLADAIAGVSVFDYETGTMWKIVNETEKDKLKAEIEKSNKNWANLCDWLGNEIANDEDEAEIYRNVLERVNQIQHYQPKWSVCASIKRIAELEAKLEEVESQYEYECECNKQFVECQKQNEQIKAENGRLKENNKSKLVELFDDENKKLKQQLKEKDEEIARQKEYYRLAKFEQDYWVNDFNKRLENNTKQVCEKIKEKLCMYDDKHRIIANNGWFGYETILGVLGQIERGEK